MRNVPLLSLCVRSSKTGTRPTDFIDLSHYASGDARDDEPAPARTRDLDRDVGALDRLDPAQEHERSVGGHARRKGDVIKVDKVRDGASTPRRGKPITQMNSLQPVNWRLRPASLGPMRSAPAGVALVGHHFRERSRKEGVGTRGARSCGARRAETACKRLLEHRKRRIPSRDDDPMAGQPKSSSTGQVDSGRATRPTVWPISRNPCASESMMRSMPPYPVGGTGMKGSAVRRILTASSRSRGRRRFDGPPEAGLHSLSRL